MPLSLTSPPAEEPVTLLDAKAQLKLDSTDDDALVTSLITAARARAEWHTGRAFVTQGWSLWLDAWPSAGIVEIPLPPLVSVSYVKTCDRDDAATIVATSAYRIDTASAPGRLALRSAPPFAANLRRLNAIEIAFTAGYGGASAAPQPIKQAILCILADLYEHRGDDDAIVGARAAALLAPYRIFKL
jgi:uncharacterized phiE125 gp8 family phage protein